jgi:DNA-binding PadR family transcriptional regulator
LRQISNDFFTVHQGSLYPALHRLEDRGWLQADWLDTDTGREAKFYSLTKKGRKQLESEVLGWEQTLRSLCQGASLRPLSHLRARARYWSAFKTTTEQESR